MTPILKFTFLLLLIPAFALQAVEDSSANSPYHFLISKEFESAIEGYERHLRDHPHDADAQFNLGIAYFEAHHFFSALDAFEKALMTSLARPAVQAKIEYNIGVVTFHQAALHFEDNPERCRNLLIDSEKAFLSAVELSSENADDAKYNLEQVRAILSVLDQTKEQSEGPNQQNSSEEENEPQGSEDESGASDGGSEDSNSNTPEASQENGSDRRDSTRSSEVNSQSYSDMGADEAIFLLERIQNEEKRITLSGKIEGEAFSSEPNW